MTGVQTCALPIYGKISFDKPVDVEKQKEQKIKKINDSIERINKLMNELHAMVAYQQEILRRPTLLK